MPAHRAGEIYGGDVMLNVNDPLDERMLVVCNFCDHEVAYAVPEAYAEWLGMTPG